MFACSVRLVQMVVVVGEDGSPIAVSFLGFSRGAYTARALAGMLHKV